MPCSRVVPTPAVAYLTSANWAPTAAWSSRQATTRPEYNGIKLFSRDGFKLPDELEDEIEEFTVSERDWERPTGADVGRSTSRSTMP
jgi:phosphoglucosamine mutase